MKTVIITGANGSLGKAVVSLFLQQSYKIIATVRKEEDKNDMPAHPNLTAEAVDLANEEETAAFVQKIIETHGRIDAALLLAGGFAVGDIAATKMSDIKNQLALNFETAYHVVQPLYPHMAANGRGRIVFIGSQPAIMPKKGKNTIAYALSKSLLFRLAEMLNEAAKGVNVVAAVVVPSTLDTAPNRQSMPDANPADWVKPEELAGILEFVCSDKSNTLRETVLKVYNNVT